uniref:Uncharacterized protein n=1 Tax=Romanomermis culicivorax TaxID=13658 RepID=A0A915L264_ROMCU
MNFNLNHPLDNCFVQEMNKISISNKLSSEQLFSGAGQIYAIPPKIVWRQLLSCEVKSEFFIPNRNVDDSVM